MRIAHRLSLAFGLVIVSALTCIVWGQWQTRALLNDYRQLLANDQQIVDLLHKAQAGMNRNARRLGRLLSDASPENVRRLQAEMEEQQRAINPVLKALESLIVDPAGLETLGQMASLRSAFLAARPKAVQAAVAGDRATAVAVLESELEPINDRRERLMDGLISSYQERIAASSQLIETTRVRAEITVGVLFGLLVAAGIGVMYWVIRSLVGPLSFAARTASEIAQGNLARTVRASSRRDEASALLRALAGMRDALMSMVERVRGGAHGVGAAATQISAMTDDLVARSQRQAANLQETATSLAHIADTVRVNAESARKVNALAQSATARAAEGGQIVAGVVAQMTVINGSARRMSEIISVIDGIAFQTNILALNAAVEAARAGEQGRGFAVVAGEVRNLAERSAAAAREVKALISDSVIKVDSGAKQADAAGRVIAEIVSAVQSVTDHVAEISAGSAEQANGIGQVEQATNALSQDTQDVSALVSSTRAAIERLDSEARALSAVVAQFSTGEGSTSAAPGSLPPPRDVAPPVLPTPESKPAGAWSGRERRGPDRARNVVRLESGAAASRRESPQPRAASGEHWESF